MHGDFSHRESYTSCRIDEPFWIKGITMKTYVGTLCGVVGIGLLALSVVSASASDKPVTGDTVIRETQEAVTATKDYTIQQKEVFQRKVQAELDEMQLRIAHLIHSATASSWEQVKSKTAAAMDDLRDSFTRARSRLP
jgi:hypothetical protein